jgi:beta-galactosidase
MVGNNDKDKPASEWLYNGNRPNSERLSVIAKELTAIVKQYDTTRPVLAAVAFPELSTRIGFTDSFDIVGYNYKEQFYEEDHRRFPDKPLLGSENSHSYEAWKAVRDNEYISGQFLWTGIDYLGEAKGWPYRASGSGSLTLAGFPKTTYYSRQSYWLESPVLYLTTAIADLNPDGSPQTETPYEWKPLHRSWNYMLGDMIEVRCFTNLSRATLYCNDKLIADKSFDNAVGFISWFIPFVPGTLKVIGYNKAGEGTEVMNTLEVIDTLITTGTACGIRLKKWTPQDGLNKCFADFDKNFIKSNLPDTFTLTQIEVTITDSYGNLVSNDSTKLQVTVSGSGKLIGIENGDITDLTEYTAKYRRAYEGRMIIYVKKENNSETINITVSGAGLKKALMEI